MLAADIEDQSGNLTRFAVIGEETGPRTGNDKCALMFEIAHKPGSLADAMAIFKRNRLNLTWIESFPISRPEGGYLFFIEMEGHELDARVRKATAGAGARRCGWKCSAPMPSWRRSIETTLLERRLKALDAGGIQNAAAVFRPCPPPLDSHTFKRIVEAAVLPFFRW